MKRASKVTLVAALVAAVVIACVGTAWSEEAPEGEASQVLVRPFPRIVPHQPRLGFYGHLEPGRGMVVDYVPWGTPAFRVGLERGDVIVQINHRRIRSYRDYFGALRTSGPICRLLVEDVRGRGRIWVFCHLRRRHGPILLGGSETPDTFAPPAPGEQPHGQFTPRSKKGPPRAFPPSANGKPTRRSASPPQEDPSARPEGAQGPLL